MIDLKLLKNDTEKILERIASKDPLFDGVKLVELEVQVRELRATIEELRSERNELARAAASGITDEIRIRSKQVGQNIKNKELELITVQKSFNDLYVRCPNIPSGDIPVGDKTKNKVVKVVGSKPSFSFPIKNHVQLGNDLGWLDFEKAAVMAGTGFALYKNDAVMLLYALTMLMLKNNREHGYQMILPPTLVNEKSLEIASNFPKFKDQVYSVPEDGLYLSPTAEVNLTNMYRDHIFTADELPVRMTSWTSCYRREAGGYGATERGLIRIHQFEKVELYALCAPENAEKEQERMLACAENLLQLLGLHYRVSLLATQDCSFPSAKTYDIEVWLPGQNTYYEVSSCSNCTDFQARRGAIRYKKKADSKTSFVYSLNGSSLALPRLMVALMEVYQQEDGSLALPEVLKKAMMVY